ncbi:arabinose efflux permease family protein [Rivularia sp. PCC 7116]|uniref:MFS transporter n=1 Tax=Rivularia sp. PCC 7116 TaxID=373994 RepID=UPI00029F2748|nr:MFS transporter [Rivularia sp. PCC 7116]AFY56406.1 arabinose efflux permease family protein [Rivularia sp. PCC 7116]
MQPTMQPDLTTTKNPLRDRNLYIIIGVTLISIMGAPTIAPILPDLAKVFDVSLNEIQLVMTVFFLPMSIATPILGVLADRVGIRKVLVPSLLLFAIAGGCISFAQDFQTLLGWRFLQGLGVTSLNVIALTMISMMYRGKALTTAMSVNVSIVGISTAIYPLIGGALAGFSWRYPFLLAVIAFPLVMLVLMVLKLPTKTSISQPSNLKNYLGNTWRSVNNTSVLGLLLAIGSIFAIQSGAFMTYVPILAGVKFGTSGLLNGLILTTMSISLAIVASQLGRLARRTSEINLIKIAFIIVAVAVLITPAINNAWLLIVPSALFGAAQGLVMPSSQALLAELAAENARAGFMAVNATVQSIGQALGPLIAGISFGLWGMEGVFWVTAAISLATLTLLNFLLTPRRNKGWSNENYR